MSWVLIFASLWVVAATVTAMLPMRMQYVPGVALLLTAPVMIAAIFWAHGIWLGIAALLAFLSVMRNPLRYLLARARGQTPELPPELRQ